MTQANNNPIGTNTAVNFDAIAMPIAAPAPIQARSECHGVASGSSARTTSISVIATAASSGASGVASTKPMENGVTASSSAAKRAARAPARRSATSLSANAATAPQSTGKNRTPSGTSPKTAVPKAMSQAITGGWSK